MRASSESPGNYTRAVPQYEGITMKSRPIFNGISVGNEEQAEDVIENFKPHKQKGRVSLVKRGTLPLVKPKTICRVCAVGCKIKAIKFNV